MPDVDEIVALFETRGNSQYGGECVTQREHALQSALLAENENASPALITAALLHDVGHLLHDLPVDAPDSGVDDHHEKSGCAYLAKFFGKEVTEPIRLHVPAKRYLCTVESTYRDGLSPPSIVSLDLQGGSMTDAEVAEFERNPFYGDAVRLRRWDDAAKIPELPTPALSHFLQYVRQAAETRGDQ